MFTRVYNYTSWACSTKKPNWEAQKIEKDDIYGDWIGAPSHMRTMVLEYNNQHLLLSKIHPVL